MPRPKVIAPWKPKNRVTTTRSLRIGDEDAPTLYVEIGDEIVKFDGRQFTRGDGTPLAVSVVQSETFDVDGVTGVAAVVAMKKK